MALNLMKAIVADRRIAGTRTAEQNEYLRWVSIGAAACVATAAAIFGARILAMVLVAWASWLLVDVSFAVTRRKPAGGGSLAFAMLFTLLCPPELPLWMIAVGAAFGCLFGKEVFGGTGHHLFNPALVGKAFLVFSYPSATMGTYFGDLFGAPQGDAWITASGVTLAAALLLAWRSRGATWIYGGILLGMAGTAAAMEAAGTFPFETQLELFVVNGALLSGCLLAVDPAGAPRDNNARLLYGLTIGICAVVMRTLSNYFEAMMCAILMGNLLAPTLDFMTARRTEEVTG